MIARPQDVALLPPIGPLPEGYKPREWECTHQAATYFYQEGHAAALASAQAREEELLSLVRDANDLSSRLIAQRDRMAEALRELARWEEDDSIIRKIALNALGESINAATQTGERT